MLFRAIGLCLSLAIIAWMMSGVLGGNKQIQNKINANPAVQEQKKALESAGVKTDDPEKLKAYTMQQAQQLEQFQNQTAPPPE